MIERADKINGQNRIKIRHSLGSVTDVKAVSAERQTGWTPCAMENGGCSHLCFYTRKSYKCACPDEPDSNLCSTSKQINCVYIPDFSGTIILGIIF